MIKDRSAGVLLHISSLPSRFGIGDLGPEAYKFADFMAKAGLKYWQLLPLNPVEGASGYSPYSGLSAFAGYPMLISPELLVEEGYLANEDLEVVVDGDQTQVQYEKAIEVKVKMLDKAFQQFIKKGTPAQEIQFEDFCMDNAHWVNDYAAYTAIRNSYDKVSWSEWPEGLKNREKSALKHIEKLLHREILKEKFLQYVFFKQWETLQAYCQSKDILFFGDIPIYVGYESADVWAHPELFKLDKEKAMTAVAGVPPDYFSETGQLWGMPVFDWKANAKKKYRWWMQRIAHNLHLFDLIRLDHFRAFAAYWEVPAGESTAINGSWKKGPDAKLFKRIKKKFPAMPIVAEDLGEIDQPVYDLMNRYDLPGMKVLLFAFGEGIGKNPYISHNHVKNAIIYTGTHDNNTVRGWYENAASDEEKERVGTYTGVADIDEKNIADHLIRQVFASVGQLAIVPMQDFLNLGEEAIMNRPSTASGNWLWRMKPKSATDKLAKKVHQQLEMYDRL